MDRARVNHQRASRGPVGGGVLLVAPGQVEGADLVLLLLQTQLTAQVAQRQVAEVVGPLVRPHQIGRQRRVADHALDRQAAQLQAGDLPLRLVQHLGSGRVGQERGQGGLVVGGRLRQGQVCRVLRARESERQRLAGPGRGPRRGLHDERDALSRAGVHAQPRGRLAGIEHAPLDLDALLRLGLGRLEGGEQPLPQHPELQAVEDAVDLLPVPAAHGQVVDRDRQLHVRHQLVEAAVADHLVEMVSGGLARLAGELVRVVDDAGEVAELGDPLRGGLGAHTWHAGEVVRALAHQRGQVAVALRRHAVLLHDRCRRHAGQV